MTIAAEVGDRSVILPMVLRGIGAGLVPDGWSDLARRAGARLYPFTPPERHPQWLVHRRGPLTPATRACIDAALRWALTGSGPGQGGTETGSETSCRTGSRPSEAGPEAL